MSRRALALIVLVCSPLTGCGSPNQRPSQTQFGDSEALVMGPNLRMVTDRDRPMPGSPPVPTMCFEPSPDVAIVFNRSLQATANITAPQGLNGQQNLSESSSEAATQLEGRSAGVLALRDGLYAACQSYANGILGHSAYALILSQYGNLLVALTHPGTAATATSAYSAQDSAVAALMVACVSEYDQTRLGAHDRSNGLVQNELLSRDFCHRLLSNIASGRLLSSPSGTRTKTATATPAAAKTATSNTATKPAPPAPVADPNKSDKAATNNPTASVVIQN